MKIAVLICRILLGVGFTIFGLNILMPFLPQPMPEPGSLAAQYMGVMIPTHWMHLVGICRLVGGLLVLIGRTAPLGLMILAPILANILAYHIFITNGQGLGPGLVFTVLEIVVAYGYRAYLASIFTTKAKLSA